MAEKGVLQVTERERERVLEKRKAARSERKSGAGGGIPERNECGLSSGVNKGRERKRLCVRENVGGVRRWSFILKGR